jgi:hypothetical protein
LERQLDPWTSCEIKARLRRRNSDMSKGSTGFPFIESMIIVTIIVIFIGLALPHVNVKIQKDKHRGTLKDIDSIAKACLEYIKENGEAPAAGVQNGPLRPGNAFIKTLEEKNLMTFPIKDRWGNPIIVYSGSASTHVDGFTEDMVGGEDFIIVSHGRDGMDEKFNYDRAHPQAGWFELVCMADFRKDLINWNGIWIRRPKL